MRSKSSRSTGQRLPGIETFASFLAQNGGGEQDKRGELISSLAASPVRTSATLGGESASTASAQDCGVNLPGSFAYFDRATSSWKTYQRSLFEDSDESSVIWPRWGLMWNGVAFQLRQWVRLTRVGDYFLLLIDGEEIYRFAALASPPTATNTKVVHQRGKKTGRPPRVAVLHPTPTVNDAKNSTFPPSLAGRDSLIAFLHPTPTINGNHNRKGASAASGDGLATFLNMMHPTSTAAEAKCHSKYSRDNDTLTSAMKRLHPSPRADGRDYAGGSNSRRIAKKRGTYFGRSLNPEYVEWLMGFPIGWTDLGDLETLSSRK